MSLVHHLALELPLRIRAHLSRCGSAAATGSFPLLAVNLAERRFSTLEFEGPDTATWRYVGEVAPERFALNESRYQRPRPHSNNHANAPNEVQGDLRDGTLVA